MSGTQNNFGGGVPGYLEFLMRTEGKANAVKYTLENREKYFDILEKSPVHAEYKPNRAAFNHAVFKRVTDSQLDKKIIWIIATAKMNQAERFGVSLGEAYGKDQDKLTTQPELMYVQIQERYHTRILADVVQIFGLQMPLVPPPFLMRQMVKAFVAMPYKQSLVFIGASEIVASHLFRIMRDEGMKLFADEPEVAARIRDLYNEIYADEIGHVGFIAAKLSPTGKAITRWLSKYVVSRIICGSIPEFTFLFGKKELYRILQQEYNVGQLASEFPARAYAAAQIS